MYNVFADFHHASLLQSLILLFERRFGGKVYRPIGREWYDLGYWHVYEHPATVAQFLDIGGANPDGTDPVNQVTEKVDGVFYCHDIDSLQTNKAITHAAFMAMPFDFVIASIPAHIAPFRRLCDAHPSHPKLIYQIGNEWNISPEVARLANGIMASARVDSIPGIPMVQYHQEFDLGVFYPDPPYFIQQQTIRSFVNCFSASEMFLRDYRLFEQIESMMPKWEFRIYGGQCRDGSAHGAQDLADKMRKSRFIWHTKYGGDGYGHIIHNAAALGRPMIVMAKYYNGKLGSDLLTDGETAIFIDGLRPNEIVNKIEAYSNPRAFEQLSRNLYDRFIKVVNFDAESNSIRTFLQNLV
jgi:hypothetical protein